MDKNEQTKEEKNEKERRKKRKREICRTQMRSKGKALNIEVYAGT